VPSALDLACACGEFGADLLAASWLGVTVRKAMKRPEALTDGRILSVPTSVPSESEEINCVDGVQDAAALDPKQVSRR